MVIKNIEREGESAKDCTYHCGHVGRLCFISEDSTCAFCSSSEDKALSRQETHPSFIVEKSAQLM